MSDLLDFAIAAHGGLERWNRFSRMRAEVTISGAIWDLKRQSGLLTDKVVELETRRERLTIAPFTASDRRSVFDTDRLAIETLGGEVVQARDHPAGAFEGQERETPWEPFHVAYFASEALWTYLTQPFLYTYPGFETEEIESWHEDGEVWRSLRVTFPDTVASHTRTQITRFGPDGLIRRHDYTVDILGGATGANYPGGHHDVEGVMMPAYRRIYAYDGAFRKVADPLLVSLDFGRISFS